ncbi:hypothetical protein ACIODS_03070 [Micromonospora chalcea]|uniref:hypothetical protein n=1 Tax=Micromonospora TaxID=1873 RepID=UPI0036862C98
MNSFKQSGLFWSVYENSAKGRFIELASIGNSAVGNLGVAVASKDRFVKSLVDSAVLVGLAERVGNDKLRFIPAGDHTLDDGESLHPSAPSPRQGEPVGSATSGFQGSATPSSPIVRQAFPVAGGEVSFQVTTSEALSPSAFMQLAKVMEELGNLAKIISPTETSSADLSE